MPLGSHRCPSCGTAAEDARAERDCSQRRPDIDFYYGIRILLPGVVLGVWAILGGWPVTGSVIGLVSLLVGGQSIWSSQKARRAPTSSGTERSGKRS